MRADGADRDPRRAALPQARGWLGAARRRHRVADRQRCRRKRARKALAAARERRARRSPSARTRCSRRTSRSPQLGLAIVDEQHRFGVAQRLALRDKGQRASAAPADDERHADPAHAGDDATTPTSTSRSSTSCRRAARRSSTKARRRQRRDESSSAIARGVREGRQVYWVCPLIEESETLELQTARRHACRAARARLPRACSVGLLHGRMQPAEKAAVMAAFAGGEIHVLVATTVIEVGVDVPNASLMVIEHAERFGLAQLHQLRGRVGRGAAESACVLLYRGAAVRRRAQAAAQGRCSRPPTASRSRAATW